MKTFETRLVPIEEAPKDGSYITAIGLKPQSCLNWNNFATVTFNEGVWHDELDELKPTNFLQFKINGEWTHEFKLEKDRR